MARLAFFLGVILTLVALAPQASASLALAEDDLAAAPEIPIVSFGGDCDALVHINCGHITANGPCLVFVGGSSGACVVWTEEEVVNVGGDCTAMVHVDCSHVTALGTCYLFVGGSNGACIVYGDLTSFATGPKLFDSGGSCDAEVHVSCDHWSGLGMCVLYVGGTDGRCIIYEG